MFVLSLDRGSAVTGTLAGFGGGVGCMRCVAVGVSSVPNEAVVTKGSILTHHFESFVDASLGNKVKRLWKHDKKTMNKHNGVSAQGLSPCNHGATQRA